LSAEFRDIPPRHRSMRAVIDVSWDQLSPLERTSFSQLSIFRGGFTREAAAAITDVTIQILSALVGKSLLRYSQSRNRYYIHELLRQYAREKLAQHASEMEALYDRHSQYFLQWFTDQVTPHTLKSAGQKTVLDAMTAEIENARAAWTWAQKNRQITRLQFSMRAFGMYYVWRGGFLEGERIFREFTRHLTDLDKSTDASITLLMASVLNWHAFFLHNVGNRAKALELLDESLIFLNSPLLAEMNGGPVRANNLLQRARTCWEQTIDVRLEHAAQARALYRDVAHPFGLPFALTSSARLAILAGRLSEAHRFLEESLEIYENTGNQLGRAISLTGLGNLAHVQNDYDKAVKLLQESANIASGMGNSERVTIALMYQGAAYLYSGQF
ncbi:MAG: tetratricopeptide repeat protein, partial [Chloroflexi bacterium]|nr:tetratricopeptide repeat protein [Chloroflexota bacterium]